MKLRLDEYYSIIEEEWEDIESYMPEDMAEEFEKFRESHTRNEIYNYLKNTMYIQPVNCMLVKVSYSQTTTKWFKLKLRQWLIC